MIGDVVHPALSVPLRKRQLVLDTIGVELEVVGFKSETRWAFRRPARVSWVLVKSADGLVSHRAASELRVVERTAAA